MSHQQLAAAWLGFCSIDRGVLGLYNETVLRVSEQSQSPSPIYQTTPEMSEKTSFLLSKMKSMVLLMDLRHGGGIP